MRRVWRPQREEEARSEKGGEEKNGRCGGVVPVVRGPLLAPPPRSSRASSARSLWRDEWRVKLIRWISAVIVSTRLEAAEKRTDLARAAAGAQRPRREEERVGATDAGVLRCAGARTPAREASIAGEGSPVDRGRLRVGAKRQKKGLRRLGEGEEGVGAGFGVAAGGTARWRRASGVAGVARPPFLWWPPGSQAPKRRTLPPNATQQHLSNLFSCLA